MLFNSIFAGWPNDLVKRVLRMTESQPIQQLAPELQAGMSVDEDPAEQWILKGKNTWSTSGPLTAGPVAGQISGVGIRNPAGSSQLVVVLGYRIVTCATGPADFSFIAGTGGTAANAVQYTDLRNGSIVNNSGAGFPMSLGFNGAAITRNPIDQHPATRVGETFTRSPWVIALPPGWQALLVNQTVNEAISALMWGYNRVLTPEELSVGGRA